MELRNTNNFHKKFLRIKYIPVQLSSFNRENNSDSFEVHKYIKILKLKFISIIFIISRYPIECKHLLFENKELIIGLKLFDYYQNLP